MSLSHSGAYSPYLASHINLQAYIPTCDLYVDYENFAIFDYGAGVTFESPHPYSPSIFYDSGQLVSDSAFYKIMFDNRSTTDSADILIVFDYKTDDILFG